MNTKLVLSSLRTLVRNKLKTFFMAIGVVIGVATLIAGQSLGAGAGKQIAERMNKMFGSGSIVIFSPRLKQQDLNTIQQQMDQVMGIAPRFTAGELEIRYRGVTRRAAVYGHSERGEYIWNRGVIEGRFFNSADIKKSARVALIGTRLAQLMFADTDPMGRQVIIDSVPFEIIGMLENIGIDPHGEDRDEDIFVPISTAMRRLNNTDIVAAAKVLVSNHEWVSEDADQIADILREQYQVAAGEKDNFHIYTSKFAGAAVADAANVLTSYLLAAAGVVLVVAATVIASIMQVVVRERIPEIGLRRAVGATRQDIRFQFLVEAMGVTVVAGVIGIGVGFIAAQVISSFIDVPVIISNDIVAMGLISALVVGIGAGILPAHTAAGLDPVKSLQ